MSGGDIGSTDKLTEMQEIERAWYLADAVPCEQAVALQERFERALQAGLRQQYGHETN